MADMSKLLRKLASSIAHQADPQIHVVIGSEFSDEESPSLVPAVPQTASAEIVEPSGKIDPVPVGTPNTSGFSYFMDGMERRRLVMYISGIPVVYGYAAAGIRWRGADKRMYAHGDPSEREALFCPRRLLEQLFFDLDIDVVDIEDAGSALEDHPMIFLEAAKKKVSDIRSKLEAEVTSRWLAEFDGSNEWLLVDGSISGNYDQYPAPNIVGVVKSHQTQYFPIEDQRKIQALRVGERSGLFIPKGRNRPDVYSWYLRLWPNEGQDLHFGLVRVEAPKCDRTVRMVDEISRWLLAERAPLSMPDSRWDRMLYPIRDCEQFLRSRAPSKTVLDAILMRFAAGRG
ncbi:MAG: hypothetical protein QHI38_00285 [Armatimonadota bacterium]|nr:hypothetical protein [Armatimonadota bacterium]